MTLVPVILSGGSGTRLWPLSTPQHPKQLHAIVGDEPMLVATMRRLTGLGAESPVVICGAEHADGVRGVLSEDEAQVVAEPMPKGTAPAVALVALTAGPDDVLIVLPADHRIADEEAFAVSLRLAVSLAEAGHLVAFGVVATHPATGYGWIEPGEPVDGGRRVASFREKPSEADAAEHLAAGWLWNSGMFCFRAGAFADELRRHRPDVLEAVEAALGTSGIETRAWERVPAASIDRGVMEPTERAVVVPLDAGWSDVGSWRSVWEVSEKDEHGNAVIGDVHLEGVTNSLVRADSAPVAVIGVDGVVVVQGEDGVLVAPLDRAEDVKDVVRGLDD